MAPNSVIAVASTGWGGIRPISASRTGCRTRSQRPARRNPGRSLIFPARRAAAVADEIQYLKEQHNAVEN
jgi:hypothetical protein